jgi:hypothetical protein
VNPELYALAAGTWLSINTSHADEGHDSHTVDWLSAYKDVLCINSWQVKRYLEAYSTSSIGGFPAADLAHVQSLYATVQSLASKPLHQDPSQLTYLDQFDTPAELDAKKREELVSKVTGLTKLVYGYLNYLDSAADLARAQWTQFGDGWMVLGLSLLVASIVVHAVALSRAMVLPMEVSQQSPGDGSVWCNTQLGEDLRTLFPFKRMLLGCGLIGLVAAGVMKGSWIFIKLLQWSPPTLSSGQSNIIMFAVILLGSIAIYIAPTKERWVQSKVNLSDQQATGTHGKQWKCHRPNVKFYFALLFVGIHAGSLLSNSYIIGEGQVVCFLLASSGILYLRTSLQGGSNVSKVCPLFHRRYLQFATSVFVSESLDATNMMSFEAPLNNLKHL